MTSKGHGGASSRSATSAKRERGGGMGSGGRSGNYSSGSARLAGGRSPGAAQVRKWKKMHPKMENALENGGYSILE